MWLAFIGGPVMLAMGGYEYYRTSRLKTQGVKTSGILVDSSTRATGKGRTAHRITLDYKLPGGTPTYRKEFSVSEAVYSQARQDGRLPVTYLPQDPTVSMAGDHLPVETEPFAIGGGLIIFGLVVWYVLRRQASKERNSVGGENHGSMVT